MSRHMACKTCRDRKVRCDGGQPSCDRCNRSGENCAYGRPANSTRVEMEQMLGSLQDRLGRSLSTIAPLADVQYLHFGAPNLVGPHQSQRAEPEFVCDFPLHSPNSFDANAKICLKARAEAHIHNTPADLASHGTSIAGVNPPAMANGFPPADLQAPFPAPSPRSAMFALNQPDFRTLNSTYSISRDSDEIMGSMNGGEPPPRGPCLPADDFARCSSRHGSMPSLSELRAMNSQHDIDTSSDMTSSSDNCSSKSANDPILQMLSSVFAVQAEISGISSAVAEYLAWIMKTPYKAEDLEVLEVLEARVCELNQLASTKHWSALKHVTASLGNGDAVKTQLRRMEAVLIDQNIKTMHFFHQKYDIRRSLLDQIPG